MVAGLALASSTALALNAPYDPLTLTCAGATQAALIIDVKAGASGAPAGFSLQWMSLQAWEDNGGAWYDSDDSRLCKQSFSGQPSFTGNTTSRWELGPDKDVQIHLGDFLYDETGASGDLSTGREACIPLCGTDYVFRAFAHASRFNSRSAFSFISNNGSPNLVEPGFTCSTDPCNGGCSYTQGYWKTHGPAGCQTGNNTNTWPVSGLTLGTVAYTDLQLCSILNTSPAGNGLISLAHQLITAKLNAALNGGPACAAGDIATADGLIGNKVVPPVGAGTLSSGAVSGLVNSLTDFNEGETCLQHCERPALKPANSNKMKWGTLKSHYK
jgi:hypothetical protein